MTFLRSLLPMVFSLLCARLFMGCGCEGVVCDVCSGVPVTVHVKDATSGEPIVDATVTIDGKDCRLMTPVDAGAYACDVPVGSYIITVTAPEHVEATRGVALAEVEDEGCCSCGPQTSTTVTLEAAP